MKKLLEISERGDKTQKYLNDNFEKDNVLMQRNANINDSSDLKSERQ